MRILAYKPSHDGSIAYVEDGTLRFCFEAEKNSRHRFAALNNDDFAHALGHLDQPPDVIGTSGWEDNLGGYWGEHRKRQIGLFPGTDIIHFASSHERSHLLAAYALSPFEQGTPCYALIWEGLIGRFYQIDARANIHAFPNLLTGPGYRFAYAYFFASPTSQSTFTGRLDLAGKMSALCGYSDRRRMQREDREFIDHILHVNVVDPSSAGMNAVIDRKILAHSPLYSSGVETQRFKNVAARISNAIFRIFFEFAKSKLLGGYPLLIGGGCALNCDWNTRWRNAGLFCDTFVPPVPNDSGSAIGTAVDAQHHFTGNAKLRWKVDCGAPFEYDSDVPAWLHEEPLNMADVVKELLNGGIVPWVQGRCEIGPRSLGSRSLLAAPFHGSTRTRINAIKRREQFRPIAPVVLEEDFAENFRGVRCSYMLHLPKVRNKRLKAVTHADGSARVQVIRADDHGPLRALLLDFKSVSGVGILCNTSLNFPGNGFINRLSEFLRFMDAHELNFAVLDRVAFRRKAVG